MQYLDYLDGSVKLGLVATAIMLIIHCYFATKFFNGKIKDKNDE